MDRRAFLQLLAIAAANGLLLKNGETRAAEDFYALPSFGNCSLLHMTDCHAQLLPVHYREPAINLGFGGNLGKPPHLVGEHLLRHFGIAAHTAQAHAFTCLDYTEAARRFGKVGGFAHLATLVKQLKADRPGALLLDGGDTWKTITTIAYADSGGIWDLGGALGGAPTPNSTRVLLRVRVTDDGVPSLHGSSTMSAVFTSVFCSSSR